MLPLKRSGTQLGMYIIIGNDEVKQKALLDWKQNNRAYVTTNYV